MPGNCTRGDHLQRCQQASGARLVCVVLQIRICGIAASE